MTGARGIFGSRPSLTGAPHIAVAGGGIAGLVAARALEQNGYACTLVESRSDASAAGAGLTMWPSALRAPRHLDVECSSSVTASGARR